MRPTATFSTNFSLIQPITGDIPADFCHLETLADWGVISAITAGRPYIVHPDLVDRLLMGAALNEPDPEGYTDCPTLAESDTEAVA